MLSEPFIALMNYSNGHNSKGDNFDNIIFLMLFSNGYFPMLFSQYYFLGLIDEKKFILNKNH